MARNRYSHSETRRDVHIDALKEIDSLPLVDSCCEICHCDCFNSHRSSDLSVSSDIHVPLKKEKSVSIQETPERKKKSLTPDDNQKKRIKKKKRDSIENGQVKSTKSALLSRQKSPSERRKLKRSKSASSVHSNSHSPHSQISDLSVRYTRDCKILQELLTSLDETPRLHVEGKIKSNNSKVRSTEKMENVGRWWSLGNLQKEQTTHMNDDRNTTDDLAPLKLCASMANLCLRPSVRKAFKQVPAHDKKILNRMATKRSEKIIAKENAWLARKFWENERYERELLKCEQMEEYKRAVRDKQYQDYLVTKARLNEITRRDLAELQRLRLTLQDKDERTKQRLNAIRVERDIQLCQRRCDELRKSEAVNIQQEEQQLEDAIRKYDLSHRVTERLQRADDIRSHFLQSYLKRLRYDNYVEQLVHEEKWQEAQNAELMKREQLKEHISRKRTKSQRFMETRQRRNDAITKNAKISANLRELVRNSVTPESALIGGPSTLANTVSLSRLLLEKSIPKLSLP